MNFVKLVIADHGKNQASVVCQRETAEHFGWDKEFQEWKPRWRVESGWHPCVKLLPDKQFSGGTRLRICRSKNKKGYPQGMTHCFRMQGTWSKRDLVRLASVAGEKFEWMESTNYARVSRDVWEAWASKR